MPWIAEEPLSEKERIELIETWHHNWRNGGNSVFGVLFEDQLIGVAEIRRRPAKEGVSLGYWIDADHSRNGFATEACAGLTDAAFRQPEITWVQIVHDKANAASAGVPRNLGFTLVEEAAREALAPAESGIVWRWVVTRTDWRLGRSS